MCTIESYSILFVKYIVLLIMTVIEIVIKGEIVSLSKLGLIVLILCNF